MANFCSNLLYEIFCQVDTINLFTYAVLRLTPRALSSGVSSWSYLRKGSTASNVATGSILAQSASVSEQNFRSRDTSLPGGDNSHHIARPLQPDRWSKGKDGFLVTDIWGTEASSSTSATPTIWLQQTEERVYVCAYQYRSLTLILLVPVASILNGEQGVSVVKQQILENVSFLPAFTEFFFPLLNPSVYSCPKQFGALIATPTYWSCCPLMIKWYFLINNIYISMCVLIKKYICLCV